MIMPRLSFEEPKGGPLAKAARAREQAEQPEERDGDATVLFEQFTDEAADAPDAETERRGNRDTVVVVLRVATVAVAIALVGFIVLLTTGGGEDPEANTPGVPKIATSHEPSTGPTTSTPPLGAIVAPPVHSQTAEIVPPPVVQPTVPTNPQPGGPQPQFVRPGEPCDTPGAYAFTESFQPMVCDGGRRGEQLTWRRMFR
jgi:hypothetical protein